IDDNDINEISRTIKLEMNKIIQNHLNKCFNNAINDNNLNEFMNIYISLIDITQNYCKTMNIEIFSLFSKYENGKYFIIVDYVFQYFEIKDEEIKASIEKEDWNVIQSFPRKYNSLVDFLKCLDFIKMK